MMQNSRICFYCVCFQVLTQDTIMQPHQVENEFPPTQDFSIKTLIRPHCEVGVHGE